MDTVQAQGTNTIYSDGSANWKDREGGIGIYFENSNKGFYQGFYNTSIGRMELLGILMSLKFCNKGLYQPVNIISDSQYAINTCNRVKEKYNFPSYAKNIDIIQAIEKEFSAFEYPTDIIQFNWVRGHKGTVGNEIADHFAGLGYRDKRENKIHDCQEIKNFITKIELKLIVL